MAEDTPSLPNTGEVSSSKLNSNIDSKENAELKRRLIEERLRTDEFMKLFKEKFDEPPVVVDLDRTEKCTKKEKCLNSECMSDAELCSPPEFARKYYSQPKGRNLFICQVCLKEAFNFFAEAEDDLRNKKTIFDRPLPTGNEVIVVDDEDDESDIVSFKKRIIKQGGDIKELLLFTNKPGMTKMIRNACNLIDYEAQVKEQTKFLKTKMDTLVGGIDQLLVETKGHQDCLYITMRNLYETYKPGRKDLEPYDVPYEEMRSVPYRNDENDCIFTGLITDTGPSNLPPLGVIERPPLCVGQEVYAMKVAVFSEWIPSIIEEIIEREVNDRTLRYYKVSIGSTTKPTHLGGPGHTTSYKKEVSAQLLAYLDPLPVRFVFGSRVIAEYVSKSKDTQIKRFYSGMVAEVPSGLNKFRYLIFFDDGRVQYCHHSALRLICDVKPCIWEHFSSKVNSFVKKYILTFPERAMLKVKNLDCVKTECKGFWVNARVVEIDCSLVHLFFLHDKHYEWLYRGSLRLYPMWAGSQNKKAAHARPRGFAARRTANGPFIQYENIVLDDDEKENAQRPIVRAVARKSSTQLPDIEELENGNRRRYDDFDDKENNPGRTYDGFDDPDNATRRLYDRKAARSGNQEQRDGTLVQKVPSKMLQPRSYRPHPCTYLCVSWIDTQESEVKGVNLLAVPVMYGFARETDVVANTVIYVAPCGRKLGNIAEVLRYLTQTRFDLSIDMFDFDPWINIFNEYVVSTDSIVLKDLSFTVEAIPISCVNTLDAGVPKYMDYVTFRRPTEGVDLNLDPDFLVGCDCTDNCQDKEKCACWQLTLTEGNCNNLNRIKDFHKETIGYQYKRLPNLVATGIYECNSRCKCKVKTCLNRVVQHPLKHKLQLFKTKHKGWGTRCLNDIPAGTFICVYVGNIFTEAVANEDGRLYGDEYFAELDYIEVCEANKEGYEDFVDPDPDHENDDEDFHPDFPLSDEEFDELLSIPTTESTMTFRERKGTSRQASCSEDEDNPAEMGNFLSAIENDKTSSGEPLEGEKRDSSNEGDEIIDLRKKNSVRALYGPKESVYIMDAKHSGNIGRYLNHSCDPNIFVQNVFVDTHDLRFPWVAFFSLKYIRAGTELTWDYRYEVDSVPGKKLRCYCLSENCRGRLL